MVSSKTEIRCIFHINVRSHCVEFNYKLKLANVDLGTRFPNNTRNSLIINSNFERTTFICNVLLVSRIYLAL